MELTAWEICSSGGVKNLLIRFPVSNDKDLEKIKRAWSALKISEPDGLWRGGGNPSGH